MVIGSCLNDYLVDHTSYHLIRDLTSLPPAKVTIHEGRVTYEIPKTQLVRDSQFQRFFIDTDYEGLTADCRSSKTNVVDSFHFNPHTMSFRAHKATIFEEELCRDNFTIKQGSQHADVDVTTTERVVNFHYDNKDVEVHFAEVWTTPLTDGNDCYFGGPPYYAIEILLPRGSSREYVRNLLNHMIPSYLLTDS